MTELDRVAAGVMLGFWTSEIGALNEITVLRGFDGHDTMMRERERCILATDPFGCGGQTIRLRFESFAPFAFMPPIVPGAYGAVYEFRTYGLEPGGVQSTIEAWEAALPARLAYSSIVIAMYALEGPTRFVHIWPFAGLDQRAEIREKTMAAGIWPPKSGARAWLTGEMHSQIMLPTSKSPLR